MIFIVSNGGPAQVFSSMITEGIQNYCADRDRIYIDLSNLVAAGSGLVRLRDFNMPTGRADGCGPGWVHRRLDGIPVLNFSWSGSCPGGRIRLMPPATARRTASG